MNLLDIFRIKIENGILTPLPYPLKQDKALCRFLCQIYQTFLIFQINYRIDILTIGLFGILLIDRYNFVHFHRVKV